MTLAIISDIHIKKPNDPGYDLLLKFLNHPSIDKLEEIVLLGDVFDFLIGTYSENIVLYQPIWDRLASLINQEKKLYFFEGNHDFHLEKFFKKIFHKLNHRSYFFYVKSSKVIFRNGLKIYLSHGDDIEIGNHFYKFYRNAIGSYFVSRLLNDFVPYEFVNNLGTFFSKRSRDNGNRYKDSDSEQLVIKNKFRKSAENCWMDGGYNLIISGHSHIKDIYHLNGQCTYINNGYALTSKSFIQVDNMGVRFVSLD